MALVLTSDVVREIVAATLCSLKSVTNRIGNRGSFRKKKKYK